MDSCCPVEKTGRKADDPRMRRASDLGGMGRGSGGEQAKRGRVGKRSRKKKV